jgi:hypothetical protein
MVYRPDKEDKVPLCARFRPVRGPKDFFGELDCTVHYSYRGGSTQVEVCVE